MKSKRHKLEDPPVHKELIFSLFMNLCFFMSWGRGCFFDNAKINEKVLIKMKMKRDIHDGRIRLLEGFTCAQENDFLKGWKVFLTKVNEKYGILLIK